MTLDVLFKQFILDKEYITGLSTNTITNYKKSFSAFCKHTEPDSTVSNDDGILTISNRVQRQLGHPLLPVSSMKVS
ncbi:MAG TPA: hypothetical protein VLR90_03255 [Blastocatellia bacterium]|nr:hypothetical protein [Blastocatellia bacterium]